MTPGARRARRGAAGGVVVAVLLVAGACTGKHDTAPPPAGPGQDASYGNGHFGHWLVDRFGLPAFEYTADQAADPAARWSSGQGSSTAFWHQVGNDRVVATAFNDGYVQLWDMERRYRLSNAYDPTAGHFGGGYGYVDDGGRALSTLYPDRPARASYRRRFGVGYFEKELRAGDLGVRQTVFAPFGDDPVLLSAVTLSNGGTGPRRLSWFEYWDVNPKAVPARLGGPGPVEAEPPARVRYDDRARTLLAEPSGGRGTRPHALFLSSLSDPVAHHESSGRRFLGTGDRARPEAVRRGRLSDAPWSRAEPTPMLALQAGVTLAPGQSHTMVFAYGYGDPASIGPLLRRLRSRPRQALERSAEAWRDALPSLRLPQDRWLERETAWNAYYLRSSATFEEGWGTHLVSQGYAYQYRWGLNIAYRDPLQHILPLAYTAPALARDTIRFAARAQPSRGYVPIGFVGRRAVSALGPGYKADDQDLWLLWAATEYVLANRDPGFLDEAHPYADGGSATIFGHLQTAFRHQLAGVGKGPHGLVRMRSGDWSDGEGAGGATESTATSAQAAWVLPYFAQVAELRGDHATATRARAEGTTLARAVAAQWTGHWFNRGYKGQAPYGVDSLYLNPQPWAVLSGAATPAQATTLAGNVKSLLSAPSPIGAASQSPSQGYGPTREEATGKGTTGGVWYALNGPAVWAFAAVAPDLAYREYKANTHATYAQAYPRNWYGVLSGPDAYDSFEAPSAGQASIMDYPVQNPHAHAWQLYDTFKLAGVEPTRAGYRIDPRWPFATFRWDSAVVGVAYEATRASGRLRASSSGKVGMRVRLPRGLDGPVTDSAGGRPARGRVSGRFVDWSMRVVRGRDTAWTVSPAAATTACPRA